MTGSLSEAAWEGKGGGLDAGARGASLLPAMTNRWPSPMLQLCRRDARVIGYVRHVRAVAAVKRTRSVVHAP